MNITESSLRRIVREMLLEAATEPSTIQFDPYYKSTRDTQTSMEVFKRMRKMAPLMQKEFTPYIASDKVVTEKNSTVDQNMAMSAYLNWYGIATGRSNEAPWSTLVVDTSWPAEALMQFQKEQGLLPDGRMGKQTATYIMSGGRIRKAPVGMKLEDADAIARGILNAERILAKLNIRVGADKYVKNPPQQIFKADGITPSMAGRGKPAPDPMAAAAAKMTAPTRMKSPSLSDRGQMGGFGGAEEFDMPIVNRR